MKFFGWFVFLFFTLKITLASIALLIFTSGEYNLGGVAHTWSDRIPGIALAIASILLIYITYKTCPFSLSVK